MHFPPKLFTFNFSITPIFIVNRQHWGSGTSLACFNHYGIVLLCCYSHLVESAFRDDTCDASNSYHSRKIPQMNRVDKKPLVSFWVHEGLAYDCQTATVVVGRRIYAWLFCFFEKEGIFRRHFTILPTRPFHVE